MVKGLNMAVIEVLQSEEFLILVRGSQSLWYERRSGGAVTALPASSLGSVVGDVICLGIAHGFLGKVDLYEGCPYLVFITSHSPVGLVPSLGEVYRVTRVVVLPLLELLPSGLSLEDLSLPPCPKHGGKTASPGLKGFFVGDSGSGKGKAFLGAVKTATSQFASATAQAAANMKIRDPPVSSLPVSPGLGASSSTTSLGSLVKERERFFRRRAEEVLRVLNEPDTLFFSLDGGDLTRSLQSRYQPGYDSSLPLHTRVDDNYFWNQRMISHLIDSVDETAASIWVLPVIMGYVEVAKCPVSILDPPSRDKPLCDAFTLALISRRSRRRVGTRYRCRGVDQDGRVANYVQTEQLLSFSHHLMSVVQIRGSVPVFWSQPGYKYKPPPRIMRSYEESHEAFVKHFETELESFHRLCVVSLIENSGPESILGREYLMHVLDMNSPKLDFVSFDFHEYCRGLKFGNVSFLIASVLELMKHLSFCWVDRQGFICQQRGAFRINCMDCLDRTNVVQAAFGRTFLEWQLSKLGLFPPGGRLSVSCEQILQVMWANNGDAVSRQYTGTNALKGDFTRTGERRLAGLMKDGMNSASRYYLSQFRDAYRQAAFDLVQDQPLDPTLFGVEEEKEGVISPEPEGDGGSFERIRLILEDAQKQLLQDPHVGTWGLIDADPLYGDPEEQDPDVILILTDKSYIVAWLDETLDSLSECESVSLSSIQGVALGPDCLRVTVRDGDSLDSYAHQFRSSKYRFFNNAPIEITTLEEKTESLRVIGESLLGAMAMQGSTNIPSISEYTNALPKLHGQHRRRPPRRRFGSPLSLSVSAGAKSAPLSSLKQLGGRVYSRAIGNVTSGLSRLKLGARGGARTPVPPTLILPPQELSEVPLAPDDSPPSTALTPSLEDPYLLESCGLLLSQLHLEGVGGALLATPSSIGGGSSENVPCLPSSGLTASLSMPHLPQAPPLFPQDPKSLSISGSRSSGELSSSLTPTDPRAPDDKGDQIVWIIRGDEWSLP